MVNLKSKLKSPFKKLVYFEDIFKDEFFEENMLVRDDGNISIGFKLDLPKRELLSDAEYQKLNQFLCDACCRLPAGTTIHQFSPYYYKSSNIRDILPTNGFVSKKIQDYYLDRNILATDSYLFICFNFTRKPKSPISTFFSAATGNGAKNQLQNFDKNRVIVRNAISQFVQLVKINKLINLREISGEEFKQIRLQYFNLDFLNQPEFYSNEIHNRGYEILVGGRHVRHVFLRECGQNIYISGQNDRGVPAPMSWALGYNLPFPHIVNTTLLVPDNEDLLKEIDSDRNKIVGLASLGGGGAESFFKNTKDFTDQVRNSSLNLAVVSQNITLWTDSEDGANFYTELAKAAFLQMNNSVAMTDSFNAGNYFFFNSPGMAGDFIHPLKMTMNQGLAFFDFTKPVPTEASGIMLCNREGEPVLVDFWSDKLSNKNRLIVGPSGSGKSFTTNVLLSQEYEQGVEIVIIDVGGSYKNLIQKNDGKYYTYSKENPISFNPFLIPKDRNGNYLLTGDKSLYLTSILTLCWKDTENNESLSKEENSVLSTLLRQYYAKLNIEKLEIPRLDRFVKFVEETCAKWLKEGGNAGVFNKDLEFFDVASFLLCMKIYIEGDNAKCLNADDSENIAGHRLVAFDMIGIKDDKTLFPIVAMIVIELILDKIRLHPDTRKEIVIDEAWSMLKGNLAHFIEYLYRTVRKSKGAVTIVTQSIGEIKDSPIGLAIKANAATKILLDHSSQNALIPDIKTFLGFTNHEIDLLFSLRNQGYAKDVFIKRENETAIFSVDVGPQATVMFSSAPDERNRIDELAKEGGMEYAINQIIEENTNR